MASVAGLLAEGLRRAILLAALADGGEPDHGVGVALVADDGSLDTANAAAGLWLAELGHADAPGERLPFVIRTVG